MIGGHLYLFEPTDSLRGVTNAHITQKQGRGVPHATANFELIAVP